MKKVLSIVISSFMLSMGVSAIPADNCIDSYSANTYYNAEKETSKFVASCKALFKEINESTEKDARTFDANVSKIETWIASLDSKMRTPQNATQKAILHCMAGWAYRTLPDMYSDMRNADVDYQSKSDEHFRAALSDMEMLAQESAMPYKDIVCLTKDGEMYEHCMLAVIADCYKNNVTMGMAEIAKLRNDMLVVYESLSKIKAYNTLYDEIRYEEIERNAPLHIDIIDEKDSVHYEELDANISYWQKVIKENASSRFINEYRNRLLYIQQPFVDINVPNVILPGKDFDAKIDFLNCTKATLEIRRFNGYKKKNRYSRELRRDGK
ncbi:MAG: hypothetical protein K6E54_03595, partial [Bacteroidaceae bacterium]|nr:hypothetical protein [Bacteroidaceae bacterium]